MSLIQLDVARELHNDRERMLAEAFRSGGTTPAFGAMPTLPRGLVTRLQSLFRFAGHRTRMAH